MLLLLDINTDNKWGVDKELPELGESAYQLLQLSSVSCLSEILGEFWKAVKKLGNSAGALTEFLVLPELWPLFL